MEKENYKDLLDRERFKALVEEHYSPDLHSDDLIKTQDDYVKCYLTYYDRLHVYVANSDNFMQEFLKQVKLHNEDYNISMDEKEMLDMASAFIIYDGEQTILLHFNDEEDVVNYYINLLYKGLDGPNPVRI